MGGLAALCGRVSQTRCLLVWQREGRGLLSVQLFDLRYSQRYTTRRGTGTIEVGFVRPAADAAGAARLSNRKVVHTHVGTACTGKIVCL